MEFTPQVYAHTDSKHDASVKPISRDQLPDALYHVTAHLPGVLHDGYLRAQNGDYNGGLGDGNGDGSEMTTPPGVSFSTDPVTAQHAYQELQRIVGIAKGQYTPASFAQWAQEDAKSSGIDYKRLMPCAHVAAQSAIDNGGSEDAMHAAYNRYAEHRQLIGGGKDAYLFGSPATYAKIDPRNIAVMAVMKHQLPGTALIRRGDDGDTEARVHADIPIGEQGKDHAVLHPERLGAGMDGDIHKAVGEDFAPEDVNRLHASVKKLYDDGQTSLRAEQRWMFPDGTMTDSIDTPHWKSAQDVFKHAKVPIPTSFQSRTTRAAMDALMHSGMIRVTRDGAVDGIGVELRQHPTEPQISTITRMANRYRRAGYGGRSSFNYDMYQPGSEWRLGSGDSIEEFHNHLAQMGDNTEKAVDGPNDVPDKPGTAPIPDGMVRRFHVTGADPDTIRTEGLRQDRARGIEGPKAIYSFNNYKHAYEYGGSRSPVVEFWDHPENYDAHPQARIGDVPPEQIVGVHEPWHSKYRYLSSTPGAADSARGVVSRNPGVFREYERALAHLDGTQKAISSFVPSGSAMQYDEPDNDATDYSQHKFWHRAGNAVRSQDDLPERLYHVTTNLPAVMSSGYLRPSNRDDIGGMGSHYSQEPHISFTPSLADAANMKRELLRTGQIARQGLTEPQLRAWAREDEQSAGKQPGDFDVPVEDALRMFQGARGNYTRDKQAHLDGYNWYMSAREGEGGFKNPIINGKPEQLSKITPENTGIIAVHSGDLHPDLFKDDGKLRTYHGDPNAEVRAYAAHVPFTKRTKVVAKENGGRAPIKGIMVAITQGDQIGVVIEKGVVKRVKTDEEKKAEAARKVTEIQAKRETEFLPEGTDLSKWSKKRKEFSFKALDDAKSNPDIMAIKNADGTPAITDLPKRLTSDADLHALAELGRHGKNWYHEWNEALHKHGNTPEEGHLVRLFFGATGDGTSVDTNYAGTLQAFSRFMTGMLDSQQHHEDLEKNYRLVKGIGKRGSNHKNLALAARGLPPESIKIRDYSDALDGRETAMPMDEWMARMMTGKEGALEDKKDSEYGALQARVRDSLRNWNTLHPDDQLTGREFQAMLWVGYKEKVAQHIDKMSAAISQRMAQEPVKSPKLAAMKSVFHKMVRSSAEMRGDGRAESIIKQFGMMDDNGSIRPMPRMALHDIVMRNEPTLRGLVDSGAIYTKYTGRNPLEHGYDAMKKLFTEHTDDANGYGLQLGQTKQGDPVVDGDWRDCREFWNKHNNPTKLKILNETDQVEPDHEYDAVLRDKSTSGEAVIAKPDEITKTLVSDPGFFKDMLTTHAISTAAEKLPPNTFERDAGNAGYNLAGVADHAQQYHDANRNISGHPVNQDFQPDATIYKGGDIGELHVIRTAEAELNAWAGSAGSGPVGDPGIGGGTGVSIGIHCKGRQEAHGDAEFLDTPDRQVDDERLTKCLVVIDLSKTVAFGAGQADGTRAALRPQYRPAFSRSASVHAYGERAADQSSMAGSKAQRITGIYQEPMAQQPHVSTINPIPMPPRPADYVSPTKPTTSTFQAQPIEVPKVKFADHLIALADKVNKGKPLTPNEFTRLAASHMNRVSNPNQYADWKSKWDVSNMPDAPLDVQGNIGLMSEMLDSKFPSKAVGGTIKQERRSFDLGGRKGPAILKFADFLKENRMSPEKFRDAALEDAGKVRKPMGVDVWQAKWYDPHRDGMPEEIYRPLLNKLEDMRERHGIGQEESTKSLICVVGQSGVDD